MEPTLEERIAALLAEVEHGPVSRERSLVRTKLQEALLWEREHQRAKEAAR